MCLIVRNRFESIGNASCHGLMAHLLVCGVGWWSLHQAGATRRYSINDRAKRTWYLFCILGIKLSTNELLQSAKMDNRLKDRIAIITGGSSGLGAATAIRFANSGARVVVADLKSAGVEKQINDKHGKDKAIFVKVDVTKESEIEAMVAEAAKWGGRVDIICNYAGNVLIDRACETVCLMYQHRSCRRNWTRVEAAGP